MLASIDDFMFEVDKNGFDSLNRVLEFRYSNAQRIGNFDSFQAVGKYEESIDFSGTLILKKQGELNEFENMAKQKKVRLLSFANGTAKRVIIKTINLNRSNFLNNGAFLKQGFTISLGVIGR